MIDLAGLFRSLIHVVFLVFSGLALWHAEVSFLELVAGIIITNCILILVKFILSVGIFTSVNILKLFGMLVFLG